MTKKNKPADDIISAAEAAKLLSKSPRQLRQLAQAGTLVGRKLNPRTWVFRRGDVLALIGQLRKPGRPPLS